jgi:putative transposase
LAICCIADCQSAGRDSNQRVNKSQRPAGCQPATQQTASLRYTHYKRTHYKRAHKRVASRDVIFYDFIVNPDEPNPGLTRVKFQLRADGVPDETPNALRSGIHSRGYLPHVKREGASYFVTFRLTDSLPKEVLLRFEQEHAEALRRLAPKAATEQVEEVHRELRRKIERYLDQGAGECHLRRPEIADLVADALRHFHDQQYLLDEWVVMPNHVHVMLWPMPSFTLSEILKSRKRHTARQANLILGRTGETFWQRESYDHWIRNDEEKARIRRYIRMNPVNARLCKTPEDWKWSSAWPGWKTAAQMPT